MKKLIKEKNLKTGLIALFTDKLIKEISILI